GPRTGREQNRPVHRHGDRNRGRHRRGPRPGAGQPRPRHRGGDSHRGGARWRVRGAKGRGWL
ncbi:MAG: hypothetical protein AVDCRST_MAG12-1547, partial [uncultured Rubrobacteraceae bacterium]